MTLLQPGDTFPDITVNLVGGDSLALPHDLAGTFGVVIFNRGSWCPFCTAQLRAFQRAQPEMAEIGASVVSLSVDDEETTQAQVEQHHLTFPVGHGADAHKLSELTGAFINPDPLYLQATGFVLDPEGRVIISTYSSGAIGRLTAEDTIGLIHYIQQQAA